VVLGSVKRLFGDGIGTTVLELIDTETVGPPGVVVLTYKRART
jgi:hypothetical protein